MDRLRKPWVVKVLLRSNHNYLSRLRFECQLSIPVDGHDFDDCDPELIIKFSDGVTVSCAKKGEGLCDDQVNISGVASFKKASRRDGPFLVLET